jgi:hypothetical protein
MFGAWQVVISERDLVSLNFASWNQINGCLQGLDALRRVA